MAGQSPQRHPCLQAASQDDYLHVVMMQLCVVLMNLAFFFV